MLNNGDPGSSDKKPKYLSKEGLPLIIALIGFIGILVSAIIGPIIVHYTTQSAEPVIEYQLEYDDQVKTNVLANQINSLTNMYYNSNDSVEKVKICANISVLITAESDIMKKYNPNYISRSNPCQPHPIYEPPFPWIWIIRIFLLVVIIIAGLVYYYQKKGGG